MPPILFQSSHNGIKIGDVIYATFCLSMSYGIQLLVGQNLECLETFMPSSFQWTQALSQDAMIMWLQPALQYLANLRANDVVFWKDLTN
jgi:hypothetical protein